MGFINYLIHFQYITIAALLLAIATDLRNKKLGLFTVFLSFTVLFEIVLGYYGSKIFRSNIVAYNFIGERPDNKGGTTDIADLR